MLKNSCIFVEGIILAVPATFLLNPKDISAALMYFAVQWLVYTVFTSWFLWIIEGLYNIPKRKVVKIITIWSIFASILTWAGCFEFHNFGRGIIVSLSIYGVSASINNIYAILTLRPRY